MLDRRTLPGLATGMGGLAAGVAAAVFHSPVLAIVAAACALAAGSLCVRGVHRVQRAERDADGRAALAKLLDIPQSARKEALSLIDEETGLPDVRFFDLALEGRVAAGRRRFCPVTVVLLQSGLAPESQLGAARSKALADIASLFRVLLREADIVCRTGDTTFALVLEDTAEEGGVWVAERVQAAMADQVRSVRRLAAGVASYPTHGLRADDVLAGAQAALTRACAVETGGGRGRVEVALPDFA